MVRPDQEAVDTFIGITGASEVVAVQKLEEHGGDLNAAVNAHFSEGERNIVHEPPMAVSPDDAMDVDNLNPIASRERPIPFPPLFPNRTTTPSFFQDPNFVRRTIFGHDPFMHRAPIVSHPRQVREIPIEVKDSSESSVSAGSAPLIQDVSEITHAQGLDIHGTVTIDDEDDEDDEDLHRSPRPRSTHVTTSVSVPETFQNIDDDVEEEMIRAAIEASRKDADKTGDFSSAHTQAHLQDDDMVQAVTMSLKSAEEEAMRGQLGKTRASESEGSKLSYAALQETHASNGRSGAQNSSFHNDDNDGDVIEQPLVRQRSRQLASASVDAPEDYQSQSPGPENLNINPPTNSSDLTSEWGGISSVEHDEAVMLEAAMFGGISETGYPLPFVRSQYNAPRPPSPSLEAQRLIRGQQDDEYLASLQADREKEMKAIREAEARHLEEEAAKRMALEEAQRKVEEEQERERQLAAKEASLPQEPSPDEENAVTLLVRMPDGTRRGRRFLLSDKLQSLFDFIDIGRAVKPGSYRLVRPYPRRAFSDEESRSTLNELGLTSKQEALFLELV